MPNIIESFTCSKTGIENNNEDGIFINDKYIAVIDGVTSIADSRYWSKTSGQFARDIIIDALGRLNGDESDRTAINAIQNRLFEEAKSLGVRNAAATAIIYSCYRKQIWSIGDCQAFINQTLIQETKLVDTVLAEARSMAISALLSMGVKSDELLSNDKGRELIMPLLKLQRAFENTNGKFGYSVFNVSDNPDNIACKVFNVNYGDVIILASDGYPLLKNTLDASEKYLSDILSKDPMLYSEHPSTKGLKFGNVSFDDRTYIKFIA